MTQADVFAPAGGCVIECSLIGRLRAARDEAGPAGIYLSSAITGDTQERAIETHKIRERTSRAAGSTRLFSSWSRVN